MMDNNNNNNMMEINTEETQKKRERKEKFEAFKKKITGFKDKLKEDKEDRQKAKEEKARVAAEEKAEKEAELVTMTTQSSSSFQEHTVTNQTIQKPVKEKRVLTPQEERQLKRKRKKLIRNIMTIPEIIIVVLLALFLKNKYIDYSKDVHQVLTYTADSYVYEIHRDNDIIKVSKNKIEKCEKEPCQTTHLEDYEIKFSKNQMTVLRTFMDTTFKLKSESKSITMKDVKTEVGKRSIYSMVHNKEFFLSTKTYGKYTVTDYEQMSSYTERGFKFDGKNLIIAMGEKPSSGYSMVVNFAFKKGDDLYFYVREEKPDEGTSSLTVITHPMVQIELQETPKNIYIYNIESGEEFKNFDAPAQTEETKKEPTQGVEEAINNLQTDLAKMFK